MLTNCKELNFKVGTELALKCISYRLNFLGQALSIFQSDESINFLSPFIKPHE